MTRAEMFEWLAALRCNSFTLSHDDGHAINYVTAKQWIEEYGNADDFRDVAPEELQAMKDTNTIWALQIYPATPVGFCIWYGATMESVVAKAMAAWPGIAEEYWPEGQP